MVADRDCLTFFDTTTTPFTRYEYIGSAWEIRLPEIDYTVTFVSIGQVAGAGIRLGVNPVNGLILYVDNFGIFRYQGHEYNVKHFGATGNGSNDDTSAINSALLAAFIAGCKPVYFPAGVYRTSSVIDANCSGQKIFGDGSKSVIMPLSSWSASSGSAVVGAYGAIGNLYEGVQIKEKRNGQ